MQVCALLPLLLAAWVAVSRIFDHKHDGSGRVSASIYASSAPRNGCNASVYAGSASIFGSNADIYGGVDVTAGALLGMACVWIGHWHMKANRTALVEQITGVGPSRGG